MNEGMKEREFWCQIVKNCWQGLIPGNKLILFVEVDCEHLVDLCPGIRFIQMQLVVCGSIIWLSRRDFLIWQRPKRAGCDYEDPLQPSIACKLY